MSNRGEKPSQGSNNGKQQEELLSVSNQLLAQFLAYHNCSGQDDLEKTEVLRQLTEWDPSVELMASVNVLRQYSQGKFTGVLVNLFAAIADGDIDLAQHYYFENAQTLPLLLRLVNQVDEHYTA